MEEAVSHNSAANVIQMDFIRNFQIGDVVIIKDDEVTRNKWPMGVVIGTFPNTDNLVRSVNVKVSTGAIWKRPITKLVLLMESTDDTNSEQLS